MIVNTDVSTSTVTFTAPGNVGQQYAVQTRVRGVVETYSYALVTGSRVRSVDNSYDPNGTRVSLAMQDGTFLLNAAIGTEVHGDIVVVDYTHQFNMVGGETLTLLMNNGNFQQQANPGLSVGGILPITEPYAGQYIYVDIVSAQPAGFNGMLKYRFRNWSLFGTPVITSPSR